jgi:hypothetical protein
VKANKCWTGYGRKQSCRNLNYYSSTCLEGLRKTTKNLTVSHNNRFLGLDLNPGPPIYEPRRSVLSCHHRNSAAWPHGTYVSETGLLFCLYTNQRSDRKREQAIVTTVELTWFTQMRARRCVTSRHELWSQSACGCVTYHFFCLSIRLLHTLSVLQRTAQCYGGGKPFRRL